MTEDWQAGGFGIYVHWPYCEAKCPYCDFNSYVVKSIDHDAWCDAYVRELDRYSAQTPGRVVRSIFFGGGTPSLMKPSTVASVIDRVGKNWVMSNDLEITLEANPSSVEAGLFADFRDAGVNRVSLGVQALNDEDLRRLGRLHSVAEARAALDIAQDCFERASFDLICARQHQSLGQWEAELKVALTLGFSHLSLYQLTIEDGTAFGDRYKTGSLRGLPDEDIAADMYDMTIAMCGDAGLLQYEVSNFAATGEESRHNQVYWRYGDYIGIGPGAHGRLRDGAGQKIAMAAARSPRDWLDRASNGTTEVDRSVLSKAEQGQEFLLMGLRLREGVALDRYQEISGDMDLAHRSADLISDGYLILDNGTLRIAQRHVGLTNAILREICAD